MKRIHRAPLNRETLQDGVGALSRMHLNVRYNITPLLARDRVLQKLRLLGEGVFEAWQGFADVLKGVRRPAVTPPNLTLAPKEQEASDQPQPVEGTTTERFYSGGQDYYSPATLLNIMLEGGEQTWDRPTAQRALSDLVSQATKTEYPSPPEVS